MLSFEPKQVIISFAGYDKHIHLRNPYCRYCEVEACAQCTSSKPGEEDEAATCFEKPLKCQSTQPLRLLEGSRWGSSGMRSSMFCLGILGPGPSELQRRGKSSGLRSTLLRSFGDLLKDAETVHRPRWRNARSA